METIRKESIGVLLRNNLTRNNTSFVGIPSPGSCRSFDFDLLSYRKRGTFKIGDMFSLEFLLTIGVDVLTWNHDELTSRAYCKTDTRKDFEAVKIVSNSFKFKT